MGCECGKLPDIFYLEDSPPAFTESMNAVEAVDWTHLFKCPGCGGFWAVDDYDKYTHQVAWRAKSRDDWNVGDTTMKRKELLLNSRGGVTDEPCIWAECKSPCVNGVTYCLEHLWNTGVRK